MSSTSLDDVTPDLQERYAKLRALFEANLPAWGLRVTCTLRSDAEQLQAFLTGHSKIDPRVPAQRAKAMHLADSSGKSRAVDSDIYSRSSGRSADKLLRLGVLSQDSYDLLYLVLMLLAERAGLRSGNDWNQDGVGVGPDPDEAFFDGGHVELRRE